MKGHTHDEYVAAALTTLQIEQGFLVWQPPRKISELVFDICTRFCSMSHDDAEKFVAKFVARVHLEKKLLRDLTVSGLMTDYGLDIREAIQFCRAALWVDVRDWVLTRMHPSLLEEIVQGRK